MQLQGKTALVKGGSGRIGFEAAKHHGAHGVKVIFNGLNAEVGPVRLKEITDAGVTAEFYACDVANEDLDNTNVKAIGDKHGIDIVLKYAGRLGGKARFEEMTTEFYKSVMALNMDSSFCVSRTPNTYLKKGTHSNIINFTTNVEWNNGGPGAYGTSKAGVHAITRAFENDLAEYSIRIDAVSLGSIHTDFYKQTKSTKTDVFQTWAKNIMLGKLGHQNDVVTLVAYTVSEDAVYHG